MQQNMLKLQQILQATLDGVPTTIAILSEGGKIIAVNESWRRFAKANQLAWSDFGIGRNYLEVCRSARGEQTEDAFKAYRGISDVILNRGNAFQMEYPCHSPEERRWYLMWAVPLTAWPVRVAVTHLNVTERKLAEEKQRAMEEDLRKSGEELRFLSSRLLTAQEDERKRIARELHDSTAQSLALMKIIIRTTMQDLDEASSPYHSLATLLPMMKETIEDVRRIISNLRPSILDNLGILATIAWHCKAFEEMHEHIAVDDRVSVTEGEVPEPLKIVVYRVLQEALNNVAKHSGADAVSVSLEKRDGELVLEIEDNGIGFYPNEKWRGQPATRGIGLSSMRERVELSGGSFQVDSAPGEGARIRAAWPENEPLRSHSPGSISSDRFGD